MSDNRVIVDSDAFIGWLVEHDLHHPQAVQLFDFLLSKGMQPVVTNLVIAESATWLSTKASQSIAKTFLREIANLEIVFIDEVLHNKTNVLFQQSQRERTSFIDYANVVAMRTFQIPTILAFDAVYRKTFGLTTLQEIAGI